MKNGLSSLKSTLEASLGGMFLTLMFFQLPLSVLGFMYLFDMVWWQAGIAALIMSGVPLINIIGGVAMSILGVVSLISMLF
ncbi:hypothetical protein [Billgrantia bachuensis]|uniref:Uncharacterized protein n=1 Tax=Billgrantia bachuensis TaxID=2717286 RepID=A0ABX0PUA0_9GAMM|nr:hypothetical protein [Halomonas bachuensis]NIC05762.1 hypothetical protein [Halomonas bachuensis]